MFDFANYETLPQLYDMKNDRIIGKFELEMPNSFDIDKMFTLEAKAYADPRGEGEEN